MLLVQRSRLVFGVARRMEDELMEQSKLDKVKFALEQMNDTYWEDVTARISTLSKEISGFTAALPEAFTELAVAKINILETRYKGYQQILAADQSTHDEIINDNKEQISQLLHQMSLKTGKCLDLHAALQVFIDETETLGELHLPVNSSDTKKP